MMTVAEAMQRARVNNCTIRKVPGEREYEVYHNMWTREQRTARAYFTDDLEDAVLTTGKLHS